MEAPDTAIDALVEEHGREYLCAHITEVDRPAEAVTAILRRSGRKLDPAVTRFLEITREVMGPDNVIDNAIDFFGSDEHFRQSLGWRCIIVRMDEARRLSQAVRDKSKSKKYRDSAWDEMKRRGLA